MQKITLNSVCAKARQEGCSLSVTAPPPWQHSEALRCGLFMLSAATSWLLAGTTCGEKSKVRSSYGGTSEKIIVPRIKTTTG